MAATIGRPVSRPATSKHKGSSESTPDFFQQFEGIADLFMEASKARNVPLLPSVTIFGDGNRVRVCFCDRNKRRSLFRTGETPLEALEAINTAIMTDHADWRPSKRAK